MINEFYGRSVIAKQKTYGFYHVGLAHIAKIIPDLPLVAIQCLLYTIPAYFLYGLDRTPEKFFAHLAILISTTLAFGEVFR